MQVFKKEEAAHHSRLWHRAEQLGGKNLIKGWHQIIEGLEGTKIAQEEVRFSAQAMG